MDFKLIWTERALADLETIVRYYQQDQKSPNAAQKVGSAIVDHVDVLRSFPDIGPRYPRHSGQYREVICYDYRIFYRVDAKARIVYVARIWHGKRDPESLEL